MYMLKPYRHELDVTSLESWSILDVGTVNERLHLLVCVAVPTVLPRCAIGMRSPYRESR